MLHKYQRIKCYFIKLTFQIIREHMIYSSIGLERPYRKVGTYCIDGPEYSVWLPTPTEKWRL